MLRILELSEAQSFVTRKAMRLAEAERVVAPILEAVRERGDEALLGYARMFDQFAGTDVRVPSEEIEAAAVSQEFLQAAEIAAANIREYSQLQLPRETWTALAGGRTLGQIVRPLSAAFHIADDRDSRAGSGSKNDMCSLPPSEPGNSGGLSLTGRTTSLPDGRSAGDRRAGIRYANSAEGGSHRRTRKYLCDGGQEATGGNRFRCGTHRDRNHRRRRGSAPYRCGHASASGTRHGSIRDSSNDVASIGGAGGG